MISEFCKRIQLIENELKIPTEIEENVYLSKIFFNSIDQPNTKSYIFYATIDSKGFYISFSTSDNDIIVFNISKGLICINNDIRIFKVSYKNINALINKFIGMYSDNMVFNRDYNGLFEHLLNVRVYDRISNIVSYIKNNTTNLKLVNKYYRSNGLKEELNLKYRDLLVIVYSNGTAYSISVSGRSRKIMRGHIDVFTIYQSF